MSYSITGSGHGADIAKVKEAFAALVQELDDATKPDGTRFEGSVSGGEQVADGSFESFSLTASEVRGAHEDPTD